MLLLLMLFVLFAYNLSTQCFTSCTVAYSTVPLHGMQRHNICLSTSSMAFMRSRRYMKDSPSSSGRLLYSTSEKTPNSLSCSMISSCFLTTYILYLLSIVNCYHSMIHTETNGRGIKNEGERKRRNIRMMSRRIILFWRLKIYRGLLSRNKEISESKRSIITFK